MRHSLPTLLAAFTILVATHGLAQSGPGSPSIPMPPAPSSPVELFRKLLTTNAAGREAWLVAKPATTRQYIEEKVREYETMLPEQREARLQALQLRWYMRYFMRMNPVERAPRLAAVPEPDRSALRKQLGQWDILPPPLKKDVLENESLLRVILPSRETGKIDSVFSRMTDAQKTELQVQHDRWNQLADDRKEQILTHFKKFFELRDADKGKVVAKLTESERAQMEKTLSKFGSLPKEEREQAVQGFKKFAELPPAEQAAFLKTAERWKAMSELDRQLWRKVVTSLQATRTVPIPPAVRPSTDRPALSSTN